MAPSKYPSPINHPPKTNHMRLPRSATKQYNSKTTINPCYHAHLIPHPNRELQPQPQTNPPMEHISKSWKAGGACPTPREPTRTNLNIFRRGRACPSRSGPARQGPKPGSPVGMFPARHTRRPQRGRCARPSVSHCQRRVESIERGSRMRDPYERCSLRARAPAPKRHSHVFGRGRACPARNEPGRLKLNNGYDPHEFIPRASTPRPPAGLAAQHPQSPSKHSLIRYARPDKT